MDKIEAITLTILFTASTAVMVAVIAEIAQLVTGWAG